MARSGASASGTKRSGADAGKRGTKRSGADAGKRGTKRSGADAGKRVVATNRQARRNFDILDTFEAGLVLKGSEVKSLREAKVTVGDAYARIIDHEAWVIGLHITPYSHAGGAFADLDPARDRKLLLKRLEIDRIKARIDQDRLALVPLALYFKDGRAKLELGLGKGRTGVDKRHHIAARDAEREAQRDVARARRGD